MNNSNRNGSVNHKQINHNTNHDNDNNDNTNNNDSSKNDSNTTIIISIIIISNMIIMCIIDASENRQWVDVCATRRSPFRSVDPVAMRCDDGGGTAVTEDCYPLPFWLNSSCHCCLRVIT